ncbi:MAG: GNAT family N-acetyltransferase [Bacteroidia bacterium]|nr:GNAT family N-acetyltransferase [Bacteroidia bacterium]
MHRISVDIKQVSIKELHQLQNIGKQTFYETFAASNTQEDMKKYLANSFSASQISAELNNPHTSYYFAWIKHTILAYMKINFGIAQSEFQHLNSMEIERLYVLKQYQRKSVGRQLLDFAIQTAQSKQLDYVWLGVWENNVKALNFYTKNGFEEFDKHIFVLGNDKQTDILMKRKII